jgi:hypothetical protein
MELAVAILAEDRGPLAIDDAIRLLSRMDPYRESSPNTWARAQHNIGVGELAHTGSARPAALNRAYVAPRSAWEVRVVASVPGEAIETTIALADVLRDALPGDPDSHIYEAVCLLREATSAIKRMPAMPPLQQARLEASLAGALSARSERSSVDDLKQAVGRYEHAVEVVRGLSPEEGGRYLPDLLMNLGVAMSRRAELTGVGWNAARSQLDEALGAIDPDAEPLRWARGAGNAAIALKNALDASANDFEHALDLLRKATSLQVANGPLTGTAGSTPWSSTTGWRR